MKAKFPQIRTIDDIRWAIEGREDIKIMNRNHGLTVCYLLNLPDTWGNPDQDEIVHWIRRECRGLLFNHHGVLISRPYHKFFNLNEKPFTASSLVDLSQPHDILEKLDGCLACHTKLITPHGEKTLQEIVNSENKIPVLGFDFDLGKHVWCQIIGTSIKPSANNWYEIEIDNGTIITITGNHLVWSVTQCKYVAVEDLQINEEVFEFFSESHVFYNKKAQIKTIRFIKSKLDRFDIQTTTGNFYANRILVHNSMIRPFLHNGEVCWGTKLGETDIARNAGMFAERNPSLMKFVREMLQTGFTPIFEWCSRSQRIVIDYPEDRLVLTAIRNMEYGNYVPYLEMCSWAAGLDIVKTVIANNAFEKDTKNNTLNNIVCNVRKLDSEEGWVIRFDSGEMLKLKADEYVRRHRVLEGLRWEKDVLALIFANELDDVRSIVSSHIRIQLDEFERVVNEGILARAHAIEIAIIDAKAKGLDRKTFALEIVNKWPHAMERDVLFQVYQGAVAVEAIIAMLKKRINSSTAVDSVRWIWGNYRWNNIAVNVALDNS